MRTLLLTIPLVLGCPLPSFAGSPVAGVEENSEFHEIRDASDRVPGILSEAPPSAPVVSAVEIWTTVEQTYPSPTGGRYTRTDWQQQDLVTFHIDVTEQTEYVSYSFEVMPVQGQQAAVTFRPGRTRGRLRDSRMEITFPWVPLDETPLELDVKITPYLPSGLAGTPTVIRVRDAGEKRVRKFG